MRLTQAQRSHLHALDSAHRDGCEDRINGEPVSVWPWDDHPDLTASYMDGYEGRAMAHECERCGQAGIVRIRPNVCDSCKAKERAPQGEVVRLFAPAPTQIPGQLTIV